MVANQDIVYRGTLLKQFTDIHTSILPQMIVYNFFKNYNTDKHIAEVAQMYGEKAKFMCEQIKAKFPSEMTLIEPDGGMFVWVTDSTGELDISKFVQRLLNEYKVAVVSGDVFMTEGGESHSFRLNYTVPTIDEIEKGITCIAELLKKMYSEIK